MQYFQPIEKCKLFLGSCGYVQVTLTPLALHYINNTTLALQKYEQALREHSKDSLTLRHNVNTVFHHPCHLLMIHKSFLIAAQHRVKKQASGCNVPILFGDLFLEMVSLFILSPFGIKLAFSTCIG
jgi:isopentenyl phosphate kinase